MNKDNLEDKWAMGQSEEEEHDTLTLTLEDDSELECIVLTTLEVNGKTYVALLPMEEEESDEEGDVFLYQYIAKENDEIELINIEEDEEFDAVSDAFDQYLDTLEFDEVFGDDDEK